MAKGVQKIVVGLEIIENQGVVAELLDQKVIGTDLKNVMEKITAVIVANKMEG